ncbi:MAG: methyltransferase domain-containing protein [Chloroflexota bacterium]
MALFSTLLSQTVTIADLLKTKGWYNKHLVVPQLAKVMVIELSKNQANKITSEEKEYYSLIERVFKGLAPFYDIVTRPVSKLRDRAVTFADARDGAKILDVATGTGKQAFAFARKGYDVTGIDLSEAMLEIAHRHNKHGVKFQAADAANLPFAASTFDVSCISFALHDMPLTIRERALREMVRVTRPEGTILIIDYALPQNKLGRFLIYHLVKLYEGKYYLEFINSDLEGLLSKAGIKMKEELRVVLGAARIWKATKPAI